MGKNCWIALLLSLALLVSTAAPAFAAGARSPQLQVYDLEDDYGGLAPPPEDNTPKRPSRPAGEGDNGGIAPDPVDNTPKRPSRPAGEGDNGGIAPDPVDNTPERPSRPAGEGDNGGIAPDQTSQNSQNTIKKKQENSPRNGSEGTVTAGITLVNMPHSAYAYGSSGALSSFNPARQVTRAEAAQMLYRLLPQQHRGVVRHGHAAHIQGVGGGAGDAAAHLPPKVQGGVGEGVGEHLGGPAGDGEGQPRRRRVKKVVAQPPKGLLGDKDGKEVRHHHNVVGDAGRHHQGDDHPRNHRGVVPYRHPPPPEPDAEGVGAPADRHRKEAQLQHPPAVVAGRHKVEGRQGDDHVPHHRLVAGIRADVGRLLGVELHGRASFLLLRYQAMRPAMSSLAGQT